MKHEAIKQSFESCLSSDEIYKKIIELGKKLPPLNACYRTSENRITGCQSILYLRGHMLNGKIYFEAYSEALISIGLAALLIEAYNGESPETLFQCPPIFLEELKISTSLLTPGRSNGLASLWNKMRQIAISFITTIER